MADGYPLVVAASPLGLAAAFVLHLLVAQFSPGRAGPGLVSGLLAGLVVTIGFGGMGLAHMRVAAWDTAALLAFNIVIYLALAYGYLNFVNLNIASVRIRVLQEFLETQKPLARSDLLALYNPAEMIARRLSRLTEQGHIIIRAGRVYRGRRILVPIAYTVDAFKWIVLHRENGILARMKDTTD